VTDEVVRAGAAVPAPTPVVVRQVEPRDAATSCSSAKSIEQRERVTDLAHLTLVLESDECSAQHVARGLPPPLAVEYSRQGDGRS
jgi:hypothetical protein